MLVGCLTYIEQFQSYCINMYEVITQILKGWLSDLIWVFTVPICWEGALLILDNSNPIVSICMGYSLRFKRVGYVINMGFHCSNILGGCLTYIEQFQSYCINMYGIIITQILKGWLSDLIWIFTVPICWEGALLILDNSNLIVSICMGYSLRFKRVGYVINMDFHCSNILGGCLTYIGQFKSYCINMYGIIITQILKGWLSDLIWIFTVPICWEGALLILDNSNLIVSICMGKSLRFKRVGYVINMGFHCSNMLGGWFTHI